MEIIQLSFFDGKVCSKCGESKPFHAFNLRDVKRPDLGYRKDCKRCRADQAQKWRSAHPEHKERKNEHEQARRDADRLAYRAQARKNWRERYYSDLPKYREKAAQQQRAYAKKEPGRSRAQGKVSRANARAPEGRGFLRVQEWIDLCEQHDNRCCCCGSTRWLSIDHVIPFSKGGMNVIDNIQPLCWECNTKKGVQVIDYRRKVSG